MTTGPPPKIIVPARNMFEKSLKRSGGFGRMPRRTIVMMKRMAKRTRIEVPICQEMWMVRASGMILISCDGCCAV